MQATLSKINLVKQALKINEKNKNEGILKHADTSEYHFANKKLYSENLRRLRIYSLIDGQISQVRKTASGISINKSNLTSKVSNRLLKVCPNLHANNSRVKR